MSQFLRGSYIFAILIIHIFLIHFIQNKKVGDEILDLLNVPSHKVRIEDLEKSCPKVSGGKVRQPCWISTYLLATRLNTPPSGSLNNQPFGYFTCQN